MTDLALYDRARLALAEAHRVDEIVAIRDHARAVAAAARIAKDDELISQATEIRLRAERRAGELLHQMKVTGERAAQGGDRKSKSPDVTLKDLGVSNMQSSRWQKLAELREQDFEQKLSNAKREVVSSLVATRAERQAEKRERRVEREAGLAAKQRALPNRRYGIIYCDPPWKFETYSEITGMDRAADNHYPTQTLDEIMALDVPSIAADDSVIFMWVTGPFLRKGFAVLENWGFEYKSRFVWGKDHIGNGYWVRDDAEELLIAVRGHIPCPAMGDQFNALQHCKKTRHSAKPDRFAEIIESYFPNLPKIELNRRGPPRPGWDAWGFEAEDAS